MRLIDADALKEKIDSMWNGRPLSVLGARILVTIDEAPTIEPKHGEWIRTGRTNIYGGIEVQCSNCGDRVMVQHLEDEWYCRHCGADMGMKGADDE